MNTRRKFIHSSVMECNPAHTIMKKTGRKPRTPYANKHQMSRTLKIGLSWRKRAPNSRPRSRPPLTSALRGRQLSSFTLCLVSNSSIEKEFDLPIERTMFLLGEFNYLRLQACRNPYQEPRERFCRRPRHGTHMRIYLLTSHAKVISL